MLRTLHWKWVGLLALTLTPALARAQAAAPETHTVRKGDTLWDLAKQYRGDPFLWPDIYRLNTAVVEDPHWIYPGELLRLAAGADTVPAVPTTDTPPPAASADTGAPVASDTIAAIPAAADTVVAAAAATAAADTGAPQKSLAELTGDRQGEGDGEPPLFGSRPSHTLEETMKAYRHQPYRALRRSEFYSSGFLTENQSLPFGRVLGPTQPQQIRANSVHANAMPYSGIVVEAPRNGTYQIGDTLLLAQLGPELSGYGDIVIPTGLARVVDTVQGRYVADLVATYGPIRNGQLTLPAEKFNAGTGEARAVPVPEGVRATFLGGNGRQDLKAPQMVVFLDKGRSEGVAPGDIFELRRRAQRLPDGSQLINDVMATVQIVHVRDHSATARVLNVLSPDIPPGTDARQIAKLPS